MPFLLIVAFLIFALISGFMLTEDSMIHLEERMFVVLRSTIFILYLLGALVLVLGSILMATRYVRAKLKAPFEPAKIFFHAHYLTLGLEILIAGEIVATTISRTYEDFFHLGLTIVIRFIIAILIYAERKMDSKTEND
jgi:uncharacterized membrane protein